MTRQPPIDRRAALALLASAPALAIAPAAEAARAPLDPDAKLLDLAREVGLMRAEYEAFAEAVERLDQAFGGDRPKRPAELTVRPFDLLAVEPHTSIRADGRRESFYGDEAVAELRSSPLLLPAGKPRADEVIAAYDEWQAALDAFEARSGIGAAEQRCEELADAYNDAFDELVAIDATTLVGLAAQASAVRVSGLDEFSGDQVARIFDGVERLAAARA